MTTGPNVQPGEKPPRIPAGIFDHTESGALDLAAFYAHAYDWTVATNSPELLEAISAPSCTACRAAIERVKDTAEAGDVVTGGRVTLRSAQLVTGHFTVQSDYVFRVVILQDPQRVTARGGALFSSAPATTSTLLLFVSWLLGQWHIVAIGKTS